MRLKRSKSWLIPFAALVLCATAASSSAQQRGVVVLPDFGPPAAITPRGVATSMPAGAMPLVKSDPDMIDWLAKARTVVEKKEYAEAVKILQALIDKPDAGFVPAGKQARRFLPLRDVALRLLGKIPSEGLEGYRRLYDPKARRKLDDAVSAGDLRGIKTVAEQYRYTRVGPEAVEALGQWYFDHARFTQAARTWRNLLSDERDDRAAIWLLKTATAYHLSGETPQAESLARKLHKQFPDARATLAGREQNLVAALETYLSIAPPTVPPVGILEHTYPGWGSLPTGRGVLPDPRVVLQPYWRHPAPDAAGLPLQIDSGNLGNIQGVTFELEDGCVSLRIRRESRNVPRPVPPMLRPVVVGNWVIYRNSERVIAANTRTGRSDPDHGWKSQSLPMERPLQRAPRPGMHRAVILHSRNLQSPLSSLYDRGRYSLTVGGGRVYTVFHFPPPAVWIIHRRGGRSLKSPTSASSLAALSLRGEGKLDWIVGWAAAPSVGGDAFLHECTFLSPPAYVSPPGRAEEGRLYTTVLHGEAFWLVCLDATNGTLIWKTQIAQTPIVKGTRYNPSALTWADTPMTPPAVAEDRVFVSTNAGVTAAFDAQTGQPLWAYQYGNATLSSRAFQRGGLRTREIRYSAAPMILSDGVVITMPVDADEVMGFSIDDGTLRWRRAKNRHLAFVDGNRLCLAGRGVSILRTGDGKVLWRNGAIECFADPVATTDSLLLCGKGCLWRISLDDYAVSNQRLQADGLLGNLVSVDGKLIAANALGLCAYSDYEQTYAGLSERMKNQPPAERIDLLQQRAELSFTAARYEQALKDYAAAEELTESLREGEEKRFHRAQLYQYRYRTYIALGNREKDTAEALAWFTRANDIARTNQAQAHMLIRIAKVYERGGRFAEAVETARTLHEQFPQEEVVDVRIGANINPRQTFGPKDATLPGKDWAHRFIDRIIRIHGRDVYAKFDAQAERALQQARRENTPEAYLAVRNRWPLSEHVDDATFKAAEVYYTRARKANDAGDTDEKLRQCEELLNDLAHRKDNPYRPSALAGLAMIYTATGRPVAVHRTRIELGSLPGDTPIAFADVRGPLEKVLHALDEDKINIPTTGDVSKINDAYLRPPLRELFSVSNRLAYLVGDQTNQPVRVGRNLLVQQDEKTVLWDASAESPEQLEILAAKTLSTADMKRHGPVSWGGNLVAALVENNDAAVIFNPVRQTAFRVNSGNILWAHSYREFGSSDFGGIGVGKELGILTDNKNGTVTAIDVVRGEVRWKAKIPMQPNVYQSQDFPVFANGGVAILSRNKHQRMISVFDPDTGKLLLRETSKNVIQTHVTSEGNLLLFHSGRLCLYKAHYFHTPASVVEFDSSKQPGILDCSGDFVALAPVRRGNEIQLYRPADLSRVPVTVRCDEGKAKVPLDVAFRGNRMYVLCSGDVDSPPRSARKSEIRSNGLAICCFDTTSGGFLWYAPLLTPRGYETIYCLSRLQIGMDHLVVTARNRLGNRQGTCFVVNRHNGKLVHSLTINSGGSSDQKSLQRNSSIGRVAIGQNRLFVETMKGITVFAGQ